MMFLLAIAYTPCPSLVPATCVGQTARKILGETGDLCDLRDGYIVGDVVSGMLVGDTWDERIILSPRN